jgi:excinuclease UvrABC nuclease subunit
MFMENKIPANIESLPLLPDTPGCYWFENAEGMVMYVGKSVALRKRVASYFSHLTLTDPRENPGMQQSYIRKLECMIRFVETIGYNQTDTELDALLLEHRLIKRHRPMYNETMRHDRKSWFIRIPDDEAFPPLLTEYIDTRDTNTMGKYDIGPFFNCYALEEAQHAITNFWQLPRCGKRFTRASDAEPCMRAHLKHCMAPCSGGVEQAVYLTRIEEAARFFQGDETAAQERVQREYQIHTDNWDFERAAKIRDTFAEVSLWAKRLARLPVDWQARYIVYAKAFHENRFMAAYAAEATIRAWVYVDGLAFEKIKASEVLETLARFIASNKNQPKTLRFPATREEGGERWTALADISAVKHYAMLPASDGFNKQGLLAFLHTQAEEFLRKIE